MFLLQTLLGFFGSMGDVFSLFGKIWYFVVPFFFPLVKYLWREYIKRVYRAKLQYVLLEIIPPKEIEKSPQPMELFFASLTGTVKGFNAYDLYVEGLVPNFFSFEIASDGGDIHFYIQCEKKYRNLVEANLFAQYPDIEIYEVEDYTKTVPGTVPNNEWDLWGVEFEATKPDLYPIRTYRFFEEDVTGKMVDPMAGILEVMAKLPPGQKMWFQLVIWTPNPRVYFEMLRETIDEFLGKKKTKKGLFSSGLLADLADVFANVFRGIFGTPEFTNSNLKEEEDDRPVEFRLRPVEKEVLKALETNLGKMQFLVKPRLVHVGRRENFDKNFSSKAFVGALNGFTDRNMNGFKKGKRSETKADFFMVEERATQRKRRIFNRYLDRDDDPDDISVYMSAEELATMFHPPDMSVVNPSVPRVPAKRSGAPANLPVFIEE
jgi:hypothetical protein